MASDKNAEPYVVDGLTPEKVVQVTSVAELSDALASATGEAVIPWGGGTRMHVGNVPTRYTTAIDLSGLSQGIQHEAGDLTVFADGGVTIADLTGTLAKQGQRLPFDVPHPEKATLGGSVASNAAGQGRSSLGGIRDWVIGMKVVLADGTVTKSGGRVVKNVQGYDLHRLQTGAFGTLGVIVEVGLKVVPIPAHASTVAVWFDSVEAAGEYAMQVFNGPAFPEALTIFAGRDADLRFPKLDSPVDPATSRALVLSAVSGGAGAVARFESDLTGLAGSTAANGYEVLKDAEAETIWEQLERTGNGDAVSMRTTLKPRDAVKLFARQFDADAPENSSGELQAGFGTLTVSLNNGTVADISRFSESAAGFGGQSVIEQCPLAIKKEIDVFGDQGQALAIMKSVKQRFDPKSVLNPGRFAGRI